VPHQRTQARKDKAAANATIEANIMSAKQYRDACTKLGISIYASAKVLGISLSSAQRYAKGSHEIPDTVARLLRALVRLGTTEV
jgi:hypothetical protein